MNQGATIRIAGTGPVSLALRGLLARQGFDAAELACDAPAAELPPWLARRTIALSLGSWQLLARIGAVPESAPILAIDVSLRGAAGHTRLTAAELGVPALGHVVRYDALHGALSRSVGATGADLSRSSDSPTTHSESLAAEADSRPAGAVTVVADGDAGKDSRLRDFDQAALLATVRARRPGAGVAFERFTDEGPLALLPLPETDRWSVVWCSRPDLARRRAALSPDAFCTELHMRFGPWLGAFELCDSPQVAPLQRRMRSSIVRGSEVAIGNAAQALHPVAGQGLNLGLRDAFVLAEHLGDARARGVRLAEALPAFARARRTDRYATVAVTDTLATLFTAPMPVSLQSLALGLLDVAAPARRVLARAFMFGLRV